MSRGSWSASSISMFPDGARVECRDGVEGRPSLGWPDRMRRVNEAVREVLSARIADGFKDPRIGFVTVTAVDTSPICATRACMCRVLGRRGGARRRRSPGSSPPTGCCSRRVGQRAAHEAHADASVRLRRVDRARDAHHRSCWTTTRMSVATEQDQVVARAARRGQAAAHDPREPRRRRARLAAGDARDPDAARQGLADVHVAGRVPAAVGVPRLTFDGLSARRRPTWTSARRLPRLRQHRPDAGRLPADATGCTSSTSTTTTTTRASAP